MTRGRVVVAAALVALVADLVTRGRTVVAAALVALVAVPVASAKFRLTLTIADSRPTVGKPVAVELRSERALDYDLRLIAVAPGKDWFDVVGAATGDSSRARASIPRDGFAVPVARVSAKRWRGYISFPRPGRWRLVIPSGAKEGFTIPPPVLLPVVVRGG